MTSITKKAKVGAVKLGSIEFEGLILPDRKQAVAIVQISCLFNIESNQASRTIQRLMGADFELCKTKADFSSNDVNFVTIDLFRLLVFRLAINGNKKAASFWNQAFPLEQIVASKHQKTSRTTEKALQKSLCKSLGGQKEVVTPAGKIDILTPDRVIEIKNVKNWKEAIGQIIVYSDYYPSHQRVVYFFGTVHTASKDLIQKHCAKLNIEAIFIS